MEPGKRYHQVKTLKYALGEVGYSVNTVIRSLGMMFDGTGWC